MMDFRPNTIFEKWAAIEVSQFDQIPDSMEKFILPEGNYAVFVHKGPVSTFDETAAYIYGSWLPKSNYQLDERPHFEIMGEKYFGPMDPNSEEEVWIPIKK